MAARFLFWTVLILFLSQNCGQQSIKEDENSEQVSASGLMGVVDRERGVSFQLERQTVDLDLQRGEIVSAENNNWQGACLQSNLLAQINQSLEESSICKTLHDYPEDILCTMDFVFPYVEVYVGDDEDRTPLGQRSSGCPAETIDLCDDESKDLETLMRSLSFTEDFGACAN